MEENKEEMTEEAKASDTEETAEAEEVQCLFLVT